MGAVRPLLLAALAALLLVTGIPPAGAASDSARAAVRTADRAGPLTVEINAVSPAAVPRRGPIELSGVVRNETRGGWQDLNAYPVVSTTPMTTRKEVQEATRTDPESTFIGERIVDQGMPLGDLAAGASSTFTLRIPRRVFDAATAGSTAAPGVYWLAVQIRATGPDGGRRTFTARTFIPLVTDGARARVSLVLPVRAPVRRTRDGSLWHAGALADSLSSSGRLGRLLDWAGDSFRTVPLTWLIDPAVVDAARTISAGDPELDLARAGAPGTAPTDGSSDEPSEGPTEEPTGDASASPAGNAHAEVPALTDLDEQNADDWLDRLGALTTGAEVLGLPYADPDVSAVARAQPALLSRARSLAASVLADADIDATPAVAPVDGRIDPDAIGTLPRDTTVLTGDDGSRQGPTARRAGGHRFVRTDTRTAAGGPAPGPRLSPLALRQRILADAALTALSGSRRTLVVTLPAHWDPGVDATDSVGPSAFFQGLDQRWLRTVGLPSGRRNTGAPELAYPRAARTAEVPDANLRAAAELTRTGTVVGHLVQGEHAIERTLSAAGLAAVSYAARTEPVRSRIRVAALEQRVDRLVDRITVTGSDFVTLSGGSGNFTVSVANGLDKTVRIGLRARTGNQEVHLETPEEIELAAGQRTTVRIEAHAESIGVHEIRMVAVTTEGEPVGTPLVFSLRTSQVGRIFWAILGAACAVLLLLVARRIRQRLRARRAAR